MSAGKMHMRLPPLRVLRVREVKREESNPCITVMSSVLACWASSGYSAAGCATVEQALRACMDGPKPTPRPPNNINFHLARMAKKVNGPRKQNGLKD
ncbi:37S ribosomal protein mitochondrial [Grosmannia clavigera kw1407]|uniref:Small ribosomal subunit protein mS37 n=1 Tax=Grosmannia clavigera (strain kw1407 / UAMH 11150) TaxID=655863 RepID=F0X7S4_GROCL|nr:37S ribosomal protein mitochondrial [Grosmannia clavigera kw1407]EFX06585.1 37S ribosomal protein mitochondrial [Grosmannia clavigera kw1407]